MDDQCLCFRFALFTQLHGLDVSGNLCHGQSTAVGCVLISEHAPCYLLILLQNCSLFTLLFQRFMAFTPPLCCRDTTESVCIHMKNEYLEVNYRKKELVPLGLAVFQTSSCSKRECHIAFGACLESFWSGVKSFMEFITQSSIYEKNGQCQLLGINFKELKEAWGSGCWTMEMLSLI